MSSIKGNPLFVCTFTLWEIGKVHLTIKPLQCVLSVLITQKTCSSIKFRFLFGSLLQIYSLDDKITIRIEIIWNS